MHEGRWLAAVALVGLVGGMLGGCEGGDGDGATGGGSQTAEQSAAASGASGEGPPDVVGEWSATDPQGSKVRFELREDGTAVWIFDEQDRHADRVEGRYTLRGEQPPYEIDIHDFESGPLQGKRFEGIYEMKGEALKMEGTPGGPRPESFGDDALEFHRGEG